MKSLFKRGELPARPEAIQKIQSVSACRAIVVTMMACALLSSCDNGSRGQTSELGKSQPDSLYKPRVNVKVNRHYDDKGNIIGFDSTYTSYYSNISGDTARMDSLMGSFDRYFRNDHSTFFRNQFDPLFFNDSARYPDFFHNDFFLRRYELNDPYFRRMMHEMDSIKNKFYDDHRKTKVKP